MGGGSDVVGEDGQLSLEDDGVKVQNRIKKH